MKRINLLAVMLIRQLAEAFLTLKVPEMPPLRRKEPSRSHMAFEREKRAFERLRPQLLKTRRGQYVVIRDEKAVLFGLNKTELAKEAYEKLGYGPLFVGLVEEAPEVVHIPTPRIAKR